MTRDQDIKRLVRDRMYTNAENYTTARSTLEAERRERLEEARIAHERIVQRFFDDDRLMIIPAKRTVRTEVLLELVVRFEPGRRYTEPEVNALLQAVHDDHAYLRRELVNVGYLERDSGVYRLATDVPRRDPRWAHEFPELERSWLPAYLRGTPETPSS